MPKIVATKDQWIELGYHLFSQTGIRGLNVDKMSKELKCNRSSFYWHFKTKSDFVHQVIDHWIKVETDQVILEVEKCKTDKEKLQKFLMIAFKNEPYLEFAFFLKRYAKNNKYAQSIVDKIDKRRLRFTADLLEKNGYSKRESEIKANIFFKFLIGHHELNKNKTQSKNYLKPIKKELKHFLEI